MPLRVSAGPPLIAAVMAGNVLRLREALALGAALEERDQWGDGTAVCYAAMEGQEECLRVLLQAGADPEARWDVSGDYASPLHLAAMGNHVSCVRTLLRHGADIEARTREGCTPLHEAAIKSSLACLHTLLENGAGVDATTPMGITPLYVAAQERQPEAMRALIEVSSVCGEQVHACRLDAALRCCRPSSANGKCKRPCVNSVVNAAGGCKCGAQHHHRR